MQAPLHVLAFAGGLFLVVATVLSAVRATVLPRAVPSRINRLALRPIRGLFRFRAGRSSNYETRDRIMAMLGPISLLVLLATWLTLILSGYALMYLAVTSRSTVGSIELSGSSGHR